MIEIGIDLARLNFQRIFQQLQNFIDMNQIVASGPFLQIILEEVSNLIVAKNELVNMLK